MFVYVCVRACSESFLTAIVHYYFEKKGGVGVDVAFVAFIYVYLEEGSAFDRFKISTFF